MAAGGTRVNYAEFACYFRRVAAASLAAEKEEAPIPTGLFLVGWMGGLSFVSWQIADSILISLQIPQSFCQNACEMLESLKSWGRNPKHFSIF